jgi:protein-tyrosine phosphatase
MIRILFVCTGNICRSPMAEAVFHDLAQKAGLVAHFSLDSAGTEGYDVGASPQPGTLRVLQANGITGYQHISRRVTLADLHTFDYVIVMAEEHEEELHSLAHRQPSTAKIARLLDYAPHLALRDVPDPYYSGAYNKVYELILAGCQGLLASIRHDHQL